MEAVYTPHRRKMYPHRLSDPGFIGLGLSLIISAVRLAIRRGWRSMSHRLFGTGRRSWPCGNRRSGGDQPREARQGLWDGLGHGGAPQGGAGEREAFGAEGDVA